MEKKKEYSIMKRYNITTGYTFKATKCNVIIKQAKVYDPWRKGITVGLFTACRLTSILGMTLYT